MPNIKKKKKKNKKNTDTTTKIPTFQLYCINCHSLLKGKHLQKSPLNLQGRIKSKAVVFYPDAWSS